MFSGNKLRNPNWEYVKWDTLGKALETNGFATSPGMNIREKNSVGRVPSWNIPSYTITFWTQLQMNEDLKNYISDKSWETLRSGTTADVEQSSGPRDWSSVGWCQGWRRQGEHARNGGNPMKINENLKKVMKKVKESKESKRKSNLPAARKWKKYQHY